MKKLFDDLKQGAGAFVQKVLAAKQPDDSRFAGKYKVEEQKKVQKLLLII